jgi:excinuclease ABC subunit B
MQFELKSKFKPTGDQPRAIKQLVKNLKSGKQHQVLLGVTGSGKTFTLANVIQKIQKPTLIISPNKTLAAQLYQEFKEFFPNNGVHYFVSYYDYYQPEAYIPQSDTYIEKDAKINEEIDRLRHSAVQDVISRRDVIVVASVSCIYNIGDPKNYQEVSLEIKSGQKMARKDFILHLTNMQYQRNDISASPSQGGEFKPGAFRVRGDIIDIYLVTGEQILRVEFSGDSISKISLAKPSVTTNYKLLTTNYKLFPATFWVAPQSKMKIAIENIKLELQERLKILNKEKKLLEAERLEQKTSYDIEMLQETGICHGIENYSRHLEFRKPGQPPFSLVDYFSYFNPSTGGQGGSLIFIDESHISIPQIRAMSVQDKIRKGTLIDFGFRLPSAIDNRPLTFKEFEQREKQTIYVSATPADYEKEKSGKQIVEQLIRPTGLLEPSIEIRKTENQIKNLMEEIKKETDKKQRVLVLTLTKRLAEEISDYLIERGIKTQYLHSEVKTMERPEILKNLRQGKYDVLVGINLLREGIDLPEVALVAILDADKEGFLRNKTTLIQTMGRAARHPNGRIILYADKNTQSMQSAIAEINRRRKIQEDYNKKHKITPKPIIKDIRDWGFSKKEDIASEFWVLDDERFDKLSARKLLEKEMKIAAKNLDFERAAEIRDLIKKLETKKQP